MYGSGIIFFLLDCLNEINEILSKQNTYDTSNSMIVASKCRANCVAIIVLPTPPFSLYTITTI